MERKCSNIKQIPEQEDSRFSMELNKYARNEVYEKVQISSMDSGSKGRQGDRAGPINPHIPMKGRKWL